MISEISSPLADQIALLKGEISKLPAKDVEFAQSLIKQFSMKGSLSDKQIPWVGKLIDKATGLAAHTPTAPKPVLPVVHGVYDAFLQAVPASTKSPAVILALGSTEDDTRALRIAKVPGKVYLRLQYRANFKHGEWIYVGALRSDDSISFAGGVSLLRGFGKTEAMGVLEEFTLDIATVLAKTGKLFGICANCGKTLTHPVSVDLGIGPICVGLFPSLAKTYASAMALYNASQKAVL